MRLRFFSKTSDHPEEPYVRPSLQLVQTDSFDSNITVRNNPGPGRNLGRLYDAVGAKIEHFLNNKADRRGLGPDAVARKIHSLRSATNRSWGECEEILAVPTDEEYVTLRKLCRKLLKYCRYLIAARLREKNITEFAS